VQVLTILGCLLGAGTQTNDTKAKLQNARFDTMCRAAELQRREGGSRAYTPQDLELFKASEFQQRVTFRGYDKVTSNPPAHGTLPPWNIRPEVISRLSRGC
jgi:hypothetical protein